MFSLRGLLLRVVRCLPFLLVAHFLETLSVGSSDEVGLHVIDAPLGVHQVLVVFTLNLDHPHDNAIDHVDRLSLFIALTEVFIAVGLTLNLCFLEVLVITIGLDFRVLVSTSPLLIELLLNIWVESDRDLEVFDDLNHLIFVHELVLRKFSLLNDVGKSLFVIDVHNFL